MSTKAVNKYKEKAYDRLNIIIPKGRKDDLQAYCERQNTTLNALVNELLRYELGMTEAAWKSRKDDNDC